MQQSPRSDRVTVARVLRPHGRRGEVAAEILTDFPERLTRLKSVELWNEKTATAKRVAVRKCWLSHSRGGQAIFHFDNSDSISAAEKFVGLEIQIPLADRVPLPDASYYVTDLIGCEVCEEKWRYSRTGSRRAIYRRRRCQESHSCGRFCSRRTPDSFGAGNL